MNKDIGEDFVEGMESKEVAIVPGTSFLGHLGNKNVTNKQITYSKQTIAVKKYINTKNLNANRLDLEKCRLLVNIEHYHEICQSSAESVNITVPNPFAFPKKKIASAEIGNKVRVHKEPDTKQMVLNPFAKRNLATKPSRIEKTNAQRKVFKSLTNFASESHTNDGKLSYSTKVEYSRTISVEDAEKLNEEDATFIPTSTRKVSEKESENIIDPMLSREETINACLDYLLGDENNTNSETKSILIKEKTNSEVTQMDFKRENRLLSSMCGNLESKSINKYAILHNEKHSEGPFSSNNSMQNASSSSNKTFSPQIKKEIKETNSRAVKRKSHTEQMPCERYNPKPNDNLNGHLHFPIPSTSFQILSLEEQTQAPFVTLLINFNGNNFCGQGKTRKLACLNAAEQIIETMEENKNHNMMSDIGTNVRTYYSAQHNRRYENVLNNNRFSQSLSVPSNFQSFNRNFPCSRSNFESFNRNFPCSPRDKCYFDTRSNYHGNETPNLRENIPNRQFNFLKTPNGKNCNNRGNHDFHSNTC